MASPDQHWPALTVWNPWAALIAAADPWLQQQHWKTVETRTWSAPVDVVDGPLLIHAGQQYDAEAAALLGDLGVRFVGGETRAWMRRLLEARGAIVAVVRLTGCRRLARMAADVRGCYSAALDDETVQYLLGSLAPSFERKFGWFLADVHALERPVLCRGAQGIWRPTPEVMTQVRAQLPGDAVRQKALL